MWIHWRFLRKDISYVQLRKLNGKEGKNTKGENESAYVQIYFITSIGVKFL